MKRRRDVLRVCSSYFRNTPREARMAVIRRVAAPYGVTVDQVLGSSRRQPVAAVRQLAMRAIAAEFADSFVQIGRFFNRDHTTVLHAVDKSQEDVDKHLVTAAKRRKRAGRLGVAIT